MRPDIGKNYTDATSLYDAKFGNLTKTLGPFLSIVHRPHESPSH